jgi:hypothetical protein
MVRLAPLRLAVKRHEFRPSPLCNHMPNGTLQQVRPTIEHSLDAMALAQEHLDIPRLDRLARLLQWLVR